jgi:hypothetical protein
MFNIFINNSLKKEAKTWDEVTKYLGLLGYDIRSIRKVEQGRWVVAYDANSATIIQVWTAEKIFHYFQFWDGGELVMKQIRSLTDKDYYPRLRQAVLKFFEQYEGKTNFDINNAAWHELDTYLALKGFHYTNKYSPHNLA